MRLVRACAAVGLGVALAHCGRFGYESLPVDVSPSRPSDAVTDSDPGASDGSIDGQPDASTWSITDGAVPDTDVDGAVDGSAETGTLANGLVGHWPLDEGSGDVVSDRSAFGNDGTLTGASWLDTSRGMALSFSDQVTNYVRIEPSASIDDIDDALSITAWVYTLGSGWEQAILSRQLGQGNDQHYALKIYQDSIELQFGSVVLGYTPTAFPSNQWFHVAATHDGNTARLYVDGTEVSSWQMGPGTLTSDTTPVLIGSRQDDQAIWSAMNGNLQELRLYERALTAREVSLLAR